MKNFVLICTAIVFIFGCAKLSVQGTKEPIKVDISMRLDIYQHVAKDIDSIEDMVSGSKDKNKTGDLGSCLDIFISNAFAQEGLDPEVEQAALRRKDRLDKLHGFEKDGIIGENKMGLVEVRDAARADDNVKQIITEENKDRMVIYKSIAAKNSTLVDEVQKLYARRLRNDAPPGAPVETLNEATGAYEWKIK